VEGKRVDEKPDGSGVRMARSMADKQAVEQLKCGNRFQAGAKRMPPGVIRGFLAKSALSRQRRFPVAD
jgi:hypothetical protein